MKKLLSLLTAVLLLATLMIPVFAEEGKVIYRENAGDFIFEPGGKESPTDLFPNFKDVMPGDSISQPILVKNNADRKVKVKIYLRSLGADEESRDFLSQLKLQVKKSADNTASYMFDAAADETAGLTDWVCLGTLYSGGEVKLDVLLTVPTTLGNEYQDEIGRLEWEFSVEEFPVDPDDPQTGDASRIEIWMALATASLIVLIVIFFVWKKKKKETENH